MAYFRLIICVYPKIVDSKQIWLKKQSWKQKKKEKTENQKNTSVLKPSR